MAGFHGTLTLINHSNLSWPSTSVSSLVSEVLDACSLCFFNAFYVSLIALYLATSRMKVSQCARLQCYCGLPKPCHSLVTVLKGLRGVAAQNADVVTSSFIFVSFHPTPNFLLKHLLQKAETQFWSWKRLFHVSLLPLLTGIIFVLFWSFSFKK